jgi:HlyD family secretion protein
MAKAARRVIDVQQRDSRIVAPFNCIISNRLLDEGTIATPNQPIVTIIEQPPLEAVFGVPAAAASSLAIGETVLISVGKDVDAVGEMPTLSEVRSQTRGLSATVVRMQPNIDPVTRTREVIVRFETDELSLVGQPATLWLPWLKLQTDGLSMNKTSFEFWVPSDALIRSVRGLWAVYAISEHEQFQGREFPTKGDEVVGSVRLYDAKILQTAGPMTKVSANLTDAAFIITEGTHRVGPGVEVVGVEDKNLEAGSRL